MLTGAALCKWVLTEAALCMEELIRAALCMEVLIKARLCWRVLIRAALRKPVGCAAWGWCLAVPALRLLSQHSLGLCKGGRAARPAKTDG